LIDELQLSSCTGIGYWSQNDFAYSVVLDVVALKTFRETEKNFDYSIGPGFGIEKHLYRKKNCHRSLVPF